MAWPIMESLREAILGGWVAQVNLGCCLQLAATAIKASRDHPSTPAGPICCHTRSKSAITRPSKSATKELALHRRKTTLSERKRVQREEEEKRRQAAAPDAFVHLHGQVAA